MATEVKESADAEMNANDEMEAEFLGVVDYENAKIAGATFAMASSRHGMSMLRSAVIVAISFILRAVEDVAVVVARTSA